MDTAIDLTTFLPDFLAEIQEHLDALTRGLLDLEGRPGDAQLVKELFRSAHTIKGTARMIGYTAVAQVAHAAENVLDDLRERRIEVNAAVVDALLGAVDAMKQLLASEGAQPESAPAEVLSRLENVKGKRTTDDGRPTIDGEPPSVAHHPPPGDETSRDSTDYFAKGAIYRAPTTATGSKEIRVSVARLDALLGQIGDLAALKTAWEGSLLELRTLARTAGEQRRFAESALKIVESLPTSAAGARLKAQILQLRDVQDRLAAGLYAATLKTTDHLEVLSDIADRLHDDVIELRLLPLATILSPLSRAIRDLAHEEGKQVTVTVTGGEVELDRRILQEISEPLLHLVRNAVSHGIELPQNRVAQGKSPLGQISLRAMRQGERVIIEIADDGRGIDPHLVRQVAVGRGVISAEQAALLDDRAALELIYTPGFSTSPFITESSGRGVGMSAVKAALHRLGGSIHISSRVGAGTTFTLSLPLTLSLIHVLLVSAGGQSVALPAADVRAIRLTPEQWGEGVRTGTGLKPGTRELSPGAGPQRVDIEGQAIALASLAQVLALPRAENGGRGQGAFQRSENVKAVLVRNGQSQAVFTVDALIDERRVTIKPVGRVLRQACEFISGATVLADGAVAFLLDPAALVSAAERLRSPLSDLSLSSAPRLRSSVPIETHAQRQARILVVDDMATTRELERSILTAAGYQVEVAGNGAQALALLRGGAFDLVVTDIEMPVMDGLALVTTLREHPRWAHLPVVLVTSLNKEEAERRARDVGAQAAIEKSSFTQDILLDTIARFVYGGGPDSQGSIPG